MSRLQRRLLAAVGVLSLLVAAAIVVVSNRDVSSGGSQARLMVSERSGVAGSGAQGDGAAGRAFDDLEPVRGGTALPETTPPPTTAPPATEPPSTTTTTGPPALTGKGTAFGPPPEGPPRVMAAGDCKSLASPGWTVEECGTATGSDGPIAWLVETKGRGARAVLLQPVGGGQWRPYLSAGDDLGARWSAIRARSAEGPAGTGDVMVGFGFRAKSGGALTVDLVRRGEVAVHLELEKGSARVSRGQLDSWSARPDGTYLHQVIRWSTEAWRVADSETMAASLVPPSHL